MFYFRFLHIPLLLAISCAALQAEDDPQELSDAREKYKKEVEFATRSIRERYLMKLDTLKRALGSRGDFHGALAVAQEVNSVKASVLEAIGVEKFAGTWRIHLTTGPVVRYVINADGYVTWNEEDGHPVSMRKGKIVFRNSQYLLELGDGNIQRLTLTGDTLNTEIFAGKDALGAGTPSFKGTSVRENRTK